MEEIRQGGCVCVCVCVKHSEERASVGCWPHLEWDPLVLTGLAEGMSEEEDIVHSDAQSQEG